MKYVQVGLGSRAAAFRRVLAGLPGFERAGLVLKRTRAAGGRTYDSLASCLTETRPDFVMCFRPASTPDTLRVAVEHGVPVLAWAPPARTARELTALADVVDSGLVHVAE
ncbi:MAG: hypothetical protein LBI33_04510, partial [Propionibacteriaceae bacterium]|nr:hypothetical protein [Propionibacteriaceae bacterium]